MISNFILTWHFLVSIPSVSCISISPSCLTHSFFWRLSSLNLALLSPSVNSMYLVCIVYMWPTVRQGFSSLQEGKKNDPEKKTFSKETLLCIPIAEVPLDHQKKMLLSFLANPEPKSYCLTTSRQQPPVCCVVPKSFHMKQSSSN